MNKYFLFFSFRRSIDSSSTITNLIRDDLPPPYQSLSASTGYPSISNLAASQNLYYSTKPLPWADGDSDFEIEETLPPFGTNIEKSVLDKLTPNERTMQEAINEIIHTEQKHVRNLKIMKHQFYEQIKKTSYLNSIELNLLFPNLDTILELHCKC